MYRDFLDNSIRGEVYQDTVSKRTTNFWDCAYMYVGTVKILTPSRMHVVPGGVTLLWQYNEN